jgi:branched-subunit amino acid aminotransferase/4-amino-4-deoxychorismate lyase
MRKVLLDVAAKNNHKVLECAILPQDLLKADEVFTCNSITGIQWIKGINNKRYYHDLASVFIQLLNQESIEYLEDKN